MSKKPTKNSVGSVRATRSPVPRRGPAPPPASAVRPSRDGSGHIFGVSLSHRRFEREPLAFDHARIWMLAVTESLKGGGSLAGFLLFVFGAGGCTNALLT